MLEMSLSLNNLLMCVDSGDLQFTINGESKTATIK